MHYNVSNACISGLKERFTVKQLTIRGVGEELHRALRDRADQRGMSINRYVLSVLRQSVGLANGGNSWDIEFDDLDVLAGTWSQQDYNEFARQLQLQRSIDRELWS